jgi:hypothetical protein
MKNWKPCKEDKILCDYCKSVISQIQETKKEIDEVDFIKEKK